jgi:hypothetical protein
MASAGYLEYDPSSRRFTLPAEHVPVLAQENGPVFFGGDQEEMVGLAGPINQSCRPSATVVVSRWRPTTPAHGRVSRLEQGAMVADVGCSQGKALVKLAQAYTRSRFVGYDNFPIHPTSRG